ncbi:hypothetical protein U6G28_07685 [Actinomycetaceae bacterium MB13-C1-2]|nr:hypothetical protein U6G28_07685 [Actinomycetaceae bacterium MB13-C1-2]
MKLTQVADRPFYTGYRSNFVFRLADDESAGDVVDAYVRQWLERVSPGCGVEDRGEDYTEIQLSEGIFAQQARSSGFGGKAEGRVFRVYLPQSLAVDDSLDVGGPATPDPSLVADGGAPERYHRTTIYAFPTQYRGRPGANILIQGATDDESILEAIDRFEVPSIVRVMLDERSCYNGYTRLTTQPVIVHRKTVKHLIDAVLDPDRTASVVAAASPRTSSDEEFAHVIGSLMRRSIGTATGFVLAETVVPKFNRQLPSHLQVPRGDVRTYLPHVDIDDPVSGARHRYTGPNTLARSLDAQQQVQGILPILHSRLPRRQMLERPLAPELLSLRAQIDRQARHGRIASLVRSHLPRPHEESAERGLGPEGQASFDEVLLSQSSQISEDSPTTESTEKLEKSLAGERATRGMSAAEPDIARIQSATDEPAYDSAGKVLSSGGLDSASDAPRQIEHLGDRPDKPAESTSDQKDTSTPSGPVSSRRITSAVDRPELDESAKGLSRVASFLRRWLYPHGHEDVSEDTVDRKITEADLVLVARDDERAAALEMVDEAQEELDHFSAQLTTAMSELADAHADAALAQEEANEYSAKLTFYRKQLMEARQFEALAAQLPEADEWNTPGDLHEIAAILTNAPEGETIREHVVFTGDIAALDAVAQRDSHGQYAAATWSFVRALYDFAQLKASGVNIDFDMYLRNNELDGHKVSVRRHARHETEMIRTRDDLRQLREFPVPLEVDPGGKVFMESHFRVGSGDGFSPRMYYLDNADRDGRIYIGYIGRHPKGFLTN